MKKWFILHLTIRFRNGHSSETILQYVYVNLRKNISEGQIVTTVFVEIQCTFETIVPSIWAKKLRTQ